MFLYNGICQIPNLINKNRNLREDVDELQFVRGDLIQAERKRRVRQLAKEQTMGQLEESPSVVEGNCVGGVGTTKRCHSLLEQ